ncbi:N-acetylglucosamine-6-phosphate deacetylase [Nocardioides marinquilinus]|uniref:N-acetylglucosamine-6-phosphate deacetylase n=1 Tax=Nocardioides marinquilinus TaxID=1210400 RepID=A0ABP9PPN2_9ACTN
MTRLGVSSALVDGRVVDGDVEVDDGVVTRIGLPPASGGLRAVPGLVDAQVNGFDGVDLMSATAEEVVHVSRALASRGVTSWLPTLITGPERDVSHALRVLDAAHASAAEGGARLLGVHLEGPFLSPRRLGTHPREHRRDPDPELLARLRGHSDRLGVVAVTLAPELPGALDLVRTLVAEGVVVSLGHSDATAAQAHAGFDAGAVAVTHCFNAMSGLHHREPGLAGAALARPGVTVQVVVDGHHLADDAVRVVFAAAAGRVVLVTDATAASARDDGAYVLAGVALEVRDGAVRNDAGDLAGSALTLDAAVRNAASLGLDPVAVLDAATAAPARMLRRDDVGSLRPGSRADVAVLDDDLVVREVLLGGRSIETAGAR